MSNQPSQLTIKLRSQGWNLDPVDGSPSCDYHNPYPTVSAVFEQVAPTKAKKPKGQKEALNTKEALSLLFKECAVELGFPDRVIQVMVLPKLNAGPRAMESHVEIYFDRFPFSEDSDHAMNRLEAAIKAAIVANPSLNCVVS